MPVSHAHFQGLGQSPFVNRTMLYISLLLWSDSINNAGNASVQHNEIIFLISVDSYGNSLANNLLHHQWPQITAVPLVRWLSNKRNVFLIILEAEKSRIPGRLSCW